LVQEAAAGGGASYAALYDRYADQVYNYCLRLTGSPEDAADATQDAFVNVLARLHQDDRPVLEFSAYLFAAARNESYALMRRRSRTQPSEEVAERAAPEPDVETEPERAALLRDSQEAVRIANGKLAPRHREVLALREVGGRSYEEIGQIMGISENAAAQLIWRARAKLKVALTAGAVASVVAATDECETAQMLINRLHDGESITDAEQEWLDEHLEECGKCRAARGMIFEVAASYRLWAPVALLATMKADVLASAGHVVGADWTSAHLSTSGAGGSSGAGGAGSGHASGAGAGSGHASGGTAAGAVAGGRAAGRFAKRPRGAQVAAGAAVTAGVFAAVGLVVAGLGSNEPNVRPDGSRVQQTAPAEKSASKRAAKDSPVATPSAALRIHSAQRVIPGQPVSLPNDRTPASAPGQGGPGTSAPHGGAPGDNPGRGPGNPGGGPGNPGGGPGNPGGGQPTGPNPPPANPPGGGQPGTPPGTDPGTTPGGTGPPPPPAGGDCSWGGHGNGPVGCPPGQGGTAPGEGGTPPGQGAPAPGHGGTPPGQGKKP